MSAPGFRRAAISMTRQLLDDIVRVDVPIGPLTTYRVGGAAALHVVAADSAALARVREAVVATGVDVLIVGRGSNMLISDRGFEGLAVQLGSGFESIEIEEPDEAADGAPCTVGVGGAVLLPVAARQLSAAGIAGFEWAVGVPGSLGGAVRMNAGGHGSDIAASLINATIIDLAGGRSATVTASDMGFGYRTSSVTSTEVVCAARLGLHRGNANASKAALADIVGWRRDHQPGGQNAGSVFANPENAAAGRLVEAAGASGMRIGSAAVSPKHANFIQADPGGLASDVLATIHAVRAMVVDHGGVTLRTELKLVGFTLAELGDLASDHVADAAPSGGREFEPDGTR